VIYCLYYGHVGILFEPIQAGICFANIVFRICRLTSDLFNFVVSQACVEMHREGYEVAQQVGNNSAAALHKQFCLFRQLYAGSNLIDVKEEIEHGMLVMKYKIVYHRVLTFIGDDPFSSFQGIDSSVFDHDVAYVINQMFTEIYFGHYERANYMAEQCKKLVDKRVMNNFRALYLYFYWGLSMIGILRKRGSNSRKVLQKFKECCEIVSNASKCSGWNFKNKASLLKAEQFSLSSDYKASKEYDTAIKAAQASKFIHEEGLAAELAAMHHERLANTATALSLFSQARECYKKWGSNAKVRQVTEKISRLQDSES
jgi:hypothetical protein